MKERGKTKRKADKEKDLKKQKTDRQTIRKTDIKN